MKKSGKPFDFVCIGSATEDVFVLSAACKVITVADVRSRSRLLCFEYGAKIPAEHMEFTTGGGGTNTAVSLARLGARAAFVGKLGRDEMARLILKELTANRVNTSYHLTSETESTGYSVILTSYEGDRTVLTHSGACRTITAGELDWTFMEKTAWVYVNSLSGSSAELLGPLAKRAARAKVSIALNPGSTQLRAGLGALRDFLSVTRILLLNKEEAARLTGKEPVHKVFVPELSDRRKKQTARWPFNPAEAFAVLCNTGPEVVVITDGSNGAQVSDGTTIYWLAASDVPVTSSLGAGDAFGSAFVLEYSRSGDPARALALGTANAASVVQVVGAKNGLMTAAQARAVLRRFDPSIVHRARLSDALASALAAPKE